MCNFTDISLSLSLSLSHSLTVDTSLVFTDANSTHTCVEHTTNCSSQHSVVTYADAITDTVQRWDVTGNEAACINTRSCGVWSLNSKQYAVQNCECSLWDEVAT